MPLQPDELQKMPEDHRHRPYYVLEKRESSILCFYGTSTQPDPKKQYVRVLVSKDMYNVWKDGYLCADGMTEIPVDCLIRKLDTLTEQTMQEVNRRITVLRHMGRYDGPLFPAGIPLRKGDIVLCRKTFFYIYRADAKIKAYPLKQGYSMYNAAGKKKIEIDVRDPRIFEKTEDLKLYGFCTPQQTAYADFHIASVKPAPKKNHPVKTLESGHYYRYDAGQYFDEIWTDERFLYLFSRGDNDYGIRERDLLRGRCKVRCFQTEYLQKSELADDETMTCVLSRLISSSRSQWGWLEELMVSS